MKKSTIIKLSNPYLFKQIKTNLAHPRKISEIRIRIILRQNLDRLCHNPQYQNFRYFWKLALDACKRNEYNDAFFLINKTIECLAQSSVSNINLNNQSNQKNLNNIDIARIYGTAGIIYRRNYQMQGSIELLEKCLGILNNSMGEDNIYSVWVIFDLIHAYITNYRAKEALFYSFKFLKLRNAQFLNLDEDEMSMIFQIGMASMMNGVKDGLRVFKICLEISKKNSNKFNYIEFRILSELCKLYWKAKKYDEMKKCFEQCLKTAEKCYFDNKIKKIDIYRLIQDYFFYIGMYDRSLYFAKKGIRNLMKSKNDHFLEIIDIYRSISAIYNAKADRMKSIHYFEKHLSLLKMVVGSKHPAFLLNSIDYISILLIDKGQYKRSLKILRNRKKELKEVFESNIAAKAMYKYQIGYVYTSLNWTKKAAKNLEEAKNMFLEHLGINHFLYIDCCKRIAVNLDHQGYLDEALAIYNTVFESYQRMYSYFHIYNASVLLKIGEIYAKKGNILDSLQNYKRSLDLIQKLEVRDAINTEFIYLRIADSYLRTGKHQLFYHYFKKYLNIETKNYLNRQSYYNYLLEIICHHFNQSDSFEACKKITQKRLKMHINSGKYNKYDTIRYIVQLAHYEIQIGGKSRYTKANKYFVWSIALYTKLIEKPRIPKKNNLVIEIYSLKAELYDLLGRKEDCLRTLKQVLNLKKLFCKKNDYDMIGPYQAIISILFKTERFHESIQVSKRALKIEINTAQNQQIISSLYTAIVWGYIKLNKIHEALPYSRLGLRIDKKIYSNTHIELKNSYYRTGICYLEIQQLDQALKYFIKAFSNAEALTNMSLANSLILNTIGKVYAHKGVFDIALSAFNSCVESAKVSEFPYIHRQAFKQNLMNIQKVIEIQSSLSTGGDIEEQVPRNYPIDLVFFSGSLTN